MTEHILVVCLPDNTVIYDDALCIHSEPSGVPILCTVEGKGHTALEMKNHDLNWFTTCEYLSMC